jgi:hypothetical protein
MAGLDRGFGLHPRRPPMRPDPRAAWGRWSSGGGHAVDQPQIGHDLDRGHDDRGSHRRPFYPIRLSFRLG